MTFFVYIETLYEKCIVILYLLVTTYNQYCKEKYAQLFENFDLKFNYN